MQRVITPRHHHSICFHQPTASPLARLDRTRLQLPSHLDFRVTFDGTPGKLAYFPNRIWTHIDLYRDQYCSDHKMISAIGEGMNKGEVADWIVQLHNESTVELNDADEFVQLL